MSRFDGMHQNTDLMYRISGVCLKMEGSNNKLIDDSFTCQKENGRFQKSVIKKNLCHYCKIVFIYMLKFISFEIDIPSSHFLFQCYQFLIEFMDKSQV